MFADGSEDYAPAEAVLRSDSLRRFSAPPRASRATPPETPLAHKREALAAGLEAWAAFDSRARRVRQSAEPSQRRASEALARAESTEDRLKLQQELEKSFSRLPEVEEALSRLPLADGGADGSPSEQRARLASLKTSAMQAALLAGNAASDAAAADTQPPSASGNAVAAALAAKFEAEWAAARLLISQPVSSEDGGDTTT